MVDPAASSIDACARQGSCRLLSFHSPNVVTGDAAQIPLPALLAHMDAVVSLASGSTAEAAMFDVPLYFSTKKRATPFRT